MGVIAKTSDRVTGMYFGRVIETGQVADVIHNPQHPYTEGLMNAIPSLHGCVSTLARIDGAMPRLNARPSGCSFDPQCMHMRLRCKTERRH